MLFTMEARNSKAGLTLFAILSLFLAGSATRDHIRIRPLLFLDDTDLTQDQIQFVETSLLPSVLSWASATLKVDRKQGNFFLERTCRSRYHVTHLCREYDEAATCGTAEVNVTLPKFMLAENTEYLFDVDANSYTTRTLPGGQGLSDTDFLLVMTAREVEGCTTNSYGFTSSCQRGELDRPEAGFINLCPSALNIPGSEKELWGETSKLLRLLAETLGFHPSFFPYLRDNSGSPRTERDAYGEIDPTNIKLLYSETCGYFLETFPSSSVVSVTAASERGLECESWASPWECSTLIRTPMVASAVQAYFSCEEAPGMELLPPSEHECRWLGKAWHPRFLLGDLLASPIGADSIYPYVSPITLAFFEDSGWYDVNYAGANCSNPETSWGYGKGCSFLTGNCLQSGEPRFPEFCSATDPPSCASTGKTFGACASTSGQTIPERFQYFTDPTLGGFPEMEYCPTVVENGCSADSYCTLSGQDGEFSPECAVITCPTEANPDAFTMEVDGESVACPVADHGVVYRTLSSGKNVTCPRSEEVCGFVRGFGGVCYELDGLDSVVLPQYPSITPNPSVTPTSTPSASATPSVTPSPSVMSPTASFAGTPSESATPSSAVEVSPSSSLPALSESPSRPARTPSQPASPVASSHSASASPSTTATASVSPEGETAVSPSSSAVATSPSPTSAVHDVSPSASILKKSPSSAATASAAADEQTPSPTSVASSTPSVSLSATPTPSSSPICFYSEFTEWSQCSHDCNGQQIRIREPIAPSADACAEIAELRECNVQESCDTCSNQQLDEGESDVDCGGECETCSLGRNCDAHNDCSADTVCSEQGACTEPSYYNETIVVMYQYTFTGVSPSGWTSRASNTVITITKEYALEVANINSDALRVTILRISSPGGSGRRLADAPKTQIVIGIAVDSTLVSEVDKIDRVELGIRLRQGLRFVLPQVTEAEVSPSQVTSGSELEKSGPGSFIQPSAGPTPDSDDEGLSGGAVALIILALVAISAIILLTIIYYRRWKAEKESSAASTQQPHADSQQPKEEPVGVSSHDGLGDSHTRSEVKIDDIEVAEVSTARATPTEAPVEEVTPPTTPSVEGSQDDVQTESARGTGRRRLNRQRHNQSEFSPSVESIGRSSFRGSNKLRSLTSKPDENDSVTMY